MSDSKLCLPSIELVPLNRREETTVPRALQWLSDNRPCYVARDTVEFRKRLGFEVFTAAPYSPESNGIAEAFVKTFKRDYDYLCDLKSEEDILCQLPAWFEDYNEKAPRTRA